MTNKAKVILGILGACAAGVAIGMVTAPCSGKETRSRIGRTTGTWVNHLGELFSKGKERLDGATEKLRHTKSRIAGKVQKQPV